MEQVTILGLNIWCLIIALPAPFLFFWWAEKSGEDERMKDPTYREYLRYMKENP